MMQAFRNSAKIIAVLFAAILLLWLIDLSGITSGTGLFSSSSAVGSIDGHAVNARSFETLVQQQTELAERQSPQQLGLDDRQAISDQVWNQMVQQEALNSEYRRYGLSATEDEVLQAVAQNPPEALQSAPDFQTDGKFDIRKYQRWLGSSAATPYFPGLASEAREQILRSKLFTLVTADVFLSDADLWQRYRDANEKAAIALTAIIPRNAVPDSAVHLTAAEVEGYYRAHRDDFKRSATAYLSGVKLPSAPNAADTAAALARADSVRERLVGGAPFDEVARQESADTASGAKGGDLGEWTRGKMDPAFDSAAFSLPLNTVSKPVLSSFGYHLIEITWRQGDKARGRHILIPIEVTGAHRDRLDAETDSLDRASGQADPAALDSVARALHLAVRRAEPVQKGGRVQFGVDLVPDAGTWAFTAHVGSTGDVVELPDALYLFRLDSILPAGIPPLSAIRPAVEQAAREAKKWDLARALAARFLAQLQAGTPVEQAAASFKLPHREFPAFTRITPPLDNPIVVGAAFGLKPGERSGVLDTKDGLYVIKVLSHVPADSAAFVKNLDSYRAEQIRFARQDRVRSYIAALVAQARVVDNRAKVLQAAQAPAAT